MSQQQEIWLGEAPEEGAKRDAIHVAVAPAIAGETLWPGDKVGFNHDRTMTTNTKVFVGVVDPFSNKLQRGERFWLILFPQTVQNLRHEWDHPQFPQVEDKEEEYYDGCSGC